jgi:hypothetical protein
MTYYEVYQFAEVTGGGVRQILRRNCRYCLRPRHQHVNSKCLFGVERFTRFGEEAIRYYDVYKRFTWNDEIPE